MNFNDAMEAADNGGCDVCPNRDQCAALGACMIYLEDEIVLEGDHDEV